MTILPLSWTNRVSDLRLMIVYHPFENGYHTQAKAKGLRGWFIASLLVVCVCICFCICICDFLPDKIHRKALQDGHGQPVSRPAVACWVWGRQSHCISATTTGEEEEEIISTKYFQSWGFYKIFSKSQLQQMSSSLQQLSASQQQQLLARWSFLWQIPSIVVINSNLLAK